MSTRIKKTKPLMRKQPTQARSRASVGAIVEAAARILSDQGWAGFTTNKVADRAGVSIGSYFSIFLTSSLCSKPFGTGTWKTAVQS